MKTPIVVTVMVAVMMTQAAYAQRPRGSSATTASAELVKGRLNPAESKPGDQVTVKLKEDVKSNGDVVLKKGTTILGVVQHVNHVETKEKSTDRVQSLIDVQWIIPDANDRPSQELMVTIQSVNQLSHLARQGSDDDWDEAPAPQRALRGQGLVTDASPAMPNPKSQSNAALLSMPSVVAVDPQTANALNHTLGLTDDSQLFETGHGQVITPGGYKDAIDIFSHLENDSVLTSASKNFEISSGAQIQLLVGVHKK